MAVAGGHKRRWRLTVPALRNTQNSDYMAIKIRRWDRSELLKV